MQYLITLDIGTTSTKTIAFTRDAQIITQRNTKYPILTTQPDYAEQDPEEIYSAVIESVQSIIKELGQDILGISFSSAMHSLILMDRNHDCLTKCIIWADNRSKNEAEALENSEIGHQIYLRTGTPIHAMSPLCKIDWFKKHRPDVFVKTAKFISMKEYIFYKFFGEYVIDHSIASATGLFDIYELDWNKQALKYLDISQDQLSKPVEITHYNSKLLPEIKQTLNLDSEIPFIIGASDGCLANLGTNSLNPGCAAITIGTSGAIRVASDRACPDQKQRIFNYLLDEKTHIIGGAINNGAIALSWFKGILSGPDGSTFSEEDLKEEMVKSVETILPGSDGLIFLPYLLGERAPIWDAKARGVFFGMSMHHNRTHFIRSIMEGVIFAIYAVAKSIEELAGEIKLINAGGGFANSAVWLQMLADIFNKKVIVNNSVESSSLGAAIVGFKALGIITDYEKLDNFILPSEVYLPDQAQHLKYQYSFDIFESLYPSLKEQFKKLDQIH